MKIQTNIPLKNKNWFKTGGPAKCYCRPRTKKDFQNALSFAKEKQLPLFFLGDGANILINDNGFDGLVVHPLNNTVSIDKETQKITAGAGSHIKDVINSALNNNLLGLEKFSGIPGTIGGATYMNIHYFDHMLDDFLLEATVISRKTGEIKIVEKEWFSFGYDKSRLHQKNYYLIDATFQLKAVTKTEIKKAKKHQNETIEKRNNRYPTERTCGSFFKNFDKSEIANNPKATTTSIAYYFEQLGFRGKLRIGDAMVSDQHSNMIVTTNNAKSHDIYTLAQMMQKAVLEKYGIKPEPECQLVGFDNKML